MKRWNMLFTLLVALVLVVPATSARALSEVNKSLLGAVAIKGYDPVAYFTEDRPVRGSKSFTFDWRGAKWRFASAEHRDLFIADPEKYAPQYGGYCAWAVSQGSTAEIDPGSWKIIEGKLYLNYDKDVQAKWEQDIGGHIAAADKYWPELIRK
ncbi:MAG: YHS domain protein [Verrucomicrobia bacterium]|nr:YHS domain protein [Verrucomicrobiota bacterium]